MKKPAVAIVYDWVDTQVGGAEQVLLALHGAFPEAPLFTSHVDYQRSSWLGNWPVQTTWLQRLPTWLRRWRLSMVLSALAFEMLDLSAYDIIISVSSATAKGVITHPQQLHICYLLTPPRYLYSHHQEYVGRLSAWLAKPVIQYLKRWDQVAQRRSDVIIPISQLIQARVSAIYHLTTEAPLYPPVELTAHNVTEADVPQVSESYFLVVSRLVNYKKIEVAIQACQQLGKQLVIIGQGPAESQLRQKAGAHVTWLGYQPTATVQHYMRHAEAVLMPGEEDFGITALEAIAQGTPVILHHQSGAAELLPHQKVAVHLSNDRVETLVAALKNFRKQEFSPQQLQQSVRKYATTTFVRHWYEVVERHWKTHTNLPKGL